MNHEIRSEVPAAVPSGRPALREQIVGKSISGVVARRGRPGEPPTVLVLQFDDGSAVEFVTPRGDRLLRQALRDTRRGDGHGPGRAQPQLALAAR